VSLLARRGLAPGDNLDLHFLYIIGGVCLFNELLVVADQGGVISGGVRWGQNEVFTPSDRIRGSSAFSRLHPV
jgi:hypothetical protein